jgi:hypothetical protein
LLVSQRRAYLLGFPLSTPSPGGDFSTTPAMI